MIHRITFSNHAYLQYEDGKDYAHFNEREYANIGAFMRGARCSMVLIDDFDSFGELPGLSA